MPNCKRCNGTERIIKSGIVRGKQRDCCKDCKCHFVIGDGRQDKGYSEATKALAILLYGSMKASYGMIAKLLNTSRKTVYIWIRKAGSKLPEPAVPDNVQEVEFDEMWPLCSLKKNSGYGKH